MIKELIKEYLKHDKKLNEYKRKHKIKEREYKERYKEIIENEKKVSESEYIKLIRETKKLRDRRHKLTNERILLAQKRNSILRILDLKCQKQGEEAIKKRKEKSSGEKIVGEILENMLVKKEIVYYEYEKRLNVKRKRNLRADYYILDKKNRKYVIEINGEQHYTKSFFNNYEIQKELDEIKEKFCKDNNIDQLNIRPSIENYDSIVSKIETHICK